MIRKRYLTVKVWIINKLRCIRIIPDVWYQSEIDLAGIRAKEIMKVLGIEEAKGL
jgi:hypothetical protein